MRNAHGYLISRSLYRGGVGRISEQIIVMLCQRQSACMRVHTSKKAV